LDSISKLSPDFFANCFRSGFVITYLSHGFREGGIDIVRTLHLVLPLGNLSKGLTEEEVRQAQLAGRQATRNRESYNLILSNGLPNSWETAREFSRGYQLPLEQGPVLDSLGSEDYLARIEKNADYRKARSAGHDPIQTLFGTRNAEEVLALAEEAKGMILEVFNRIPKFEKAIAFSISPLIELAVWSYRKDMELPEDFKCLSPLEGAVLIQEGTQVWVKRTKITISHPQGQPV
jgi:hypothetical protein